MNKSIIAVFDLDGTLTACRSIESSFIMYLLKTSRLPLRNLISSAAFYIQNVPKNPVLAVKKNKMYIKGVSSELAMSWIKDFLTEKSGSLLNEGCIDLIKKHRRMGHITVLITGSPEILVTPLFPGSLFDVCYTTSLESVNGLYTGLVKGDFYYGAAKKDLTLHIAEMQGADLAKSYCYANSGTDIDMMSLFGIPVAVRPDSSLRNRALKHGWKMLN